MRTRYRKTRSFSVGVKSATSYSQEGPYEQAIEAGPGEARPGGATAPCGEEEERRWPPSTQRLPARPPRLRSSLGRRRHAGERRCLATRPSPREARRWRRPRPSLWSEVCEVKKRARGKKEQQGHGQGAGGRPGAGSAVPWGGPAGWARRPHPARGWRCSVWGAVAAAATAVPLRAPRGGRQSPAVARGAHGWLR